ncbi:MAG: hypothetical protein ACRDMJ_05200 [Solirubrobacteraceae bacterium]
MPTVHSVTLALPAVAIVAIVAVSALLARVGSDARWLAALGHVIVARHGIPAGIPFASTPTAHWPNALVLAELIFNALEGALGDRGLMLAQIVAITGGLAIVARDARAGGARSGPIAVALVLAAAGSIASLAIVRVQLFSLLLFPALVALLRSQARVPSKAIWLAVPLLALWSNLHGAALLGLAVLLGHLLLARARREPLRALAVAVAATVALCLTPALWRTPAYYVGVLTNVAAQRGVGMWGPLSLSSPFDLLLIVAALAGLALVLARRAWPAMWELAVLAGLALLTIRADRDGVWLMLFAAPIVARALRRERSPRKHALAPIIGAAAVALLGFAIARGPVPDGASPSLLRSALALSHGSPILADGAIDEQVALAGGRIWAGDPIDAFPRSVQAAYLDWLAGARSGAAAVTPAVRVALVTRGSAAQVLMTRLRGFVVARADAGTLLYERNG